MQGGRPPTSAKMRSSSAAAALLASNCASASSYRLQWAAAAKCRGQGVNVVRRGAPCLGALEGVAQMGAVGRRALLIFRHEKFHMTRHLPCMLVHNAGNVHSRRGLQLQLRRSGSAQTASSGPEPFLPHTGGSQPAPQTATPPPFPPTHFSCAAVSESCSSMLRASSATPWSTLLPPVLLLLLLLLLPLVLVMADSAAWASGDALPLLLGMGCGACEVRVGEGWGCAGIAAAEAAATAWHGLQARTRLGGRARTQLVRGCTTARTSSVLPAAAASRVGLEGARWTAGVGRVSCAVLCKQACMSARAACMRACLCVRACVHAFARASLIVSMCARMR